MREVLRYLLLKIRMPRAGLPLAYAKTSSGGVVLAIACFFQTTSMEDVA